MSDPRFDVVVVRCSGEECDYEYGEDVEAAYEAYEEADSCPGCNRSADPTVVRVNLLDELVEAHRSTEEYLLWLSGRRPDLKPRLDPVLASQRALVASVLEAVR